MDILYLYVGSACKIICVLNMSASSNLYITIFNVLGLVFIFFVLGLSIDDNKMRERMKVFGFAVVVSIVLNLILYLR